MCICMYFEQRPFNQYRMQFWNVFWIIKLFPPLWWKKHFCRILQNSNYINNIIMSQIKDQNSSNLFLSKNHSNYCKTCTFPPNTFKWFPPTNLSFSHQKTVSWTWMAKQQKVRIFIQSERKVKTKPYFSIC
jgi:hypothetical protein